MTRDRLRDTAIEGLVSGLTRWAPVIAIIVGLNRLGGCVAPWDVQSETAAVEQHQTLRTAITEGDAGTKDDIVRELGARMDRVTGQLGTLSERIDRIYQRRRR